MQTEDFFCCSSVAIEVKAWQYMSTIMMTSHYTDSVILYSLQENHLYNWRSKKQPQKGKKIFFYPLHHCINDFMYYYYLILITCQLNLSVPWLASPPTDCCFPSVSSLFFFTAATFSSWFTCVYFTFNHLVNSTTRNHEILTNKVAT